MEKSIINRRGEYLVVVDVAGTPRDKYSHPAGTWECAMTLADGSPQIIRGAYADGPVMQSIRPDEQAQWAVVGSVSDDKFINILKLLATSKTNAAAALGSIKSAKKAASSRENGRLGGRPKYTYTDNYHAHLGLDGRTTCIVPDQVADDQEKYDGRTFPAILNGEKIRVKLIGDDYGLHTSGTGDMVVRRA